MTMRSYEPSIPRAVVGVMAIVMSAVTMGSLVVVPAMMEVDVRDPGMLAAPRDGSSPLTNAVTDAAIDFVAAHEVISIPCTGSTPDAEDHGGLRGLQDAAGDPHSAIATGKYAEPRRKRTL